jgi:[ribosomal protein S18]-alanine N-acetyltransferase
MTNKRPTNLSDANGTSWGAMRQQFRRVFFEENLTLTESLGKPEYVKRRGYNDGVEFTLRDFRREDFETLWRIDQECFAPGIAYSQLELAAYIRLRGAFTVVAESVATRRERPGSSVRPLTDDSPKLLGFIVAQVTRRRVGHILTIDVPSSSRRFGVGSKLLATAEDRLEAADCHSVELETAVDNAGALAFYKRHQYSVVGTIPRYYTNGVDAFVLEKEL